VTFKLTVTVREGVFVYAGTRLDGSSKWAYYARKPDGSFEGEPPPIRMKVLVSKEKRDYAKYADQKGPRALAYAGKPH
jgi:hypothetical protein